MGLVRTLTKSKTKVAVLCGGPGGEREVSLASGENVHNTLITAGLQCEKIELPPVNPEQILENIDCQIAVMMLHGEFGEDGKAQQILEHRGIAFTGSDSKACALSMDKNESKEMFVKNAIPTPRWIVSDNITDVIKEVNAKDLKYPLFIKPNRGGSSVGVARVQNQEELTIEAAKTLAIAPEAIVEEMVIGRELTVGWLAGEVLPIIELVADGEFYDYQAKYISNNTRYICPAVLSAEITENMNRQIARTAEILGVRDLSRVDVMLGDSGPQILELNALPGFTSHSLLPMAAAKSGIDMQTLCLSLVEMAAARAGIYK